MKVGDKVSFLSETGGGVIAGFQGKDIVLVEDADGFQIPTPISEVVVVSNADYSMSNMVAAQQAPKADTKGKSIKAMLTSDDEDEETADDTDEVDLSREITFKAPAEERKGGNMLSCYLAFVPLNIKEMTTTRFEAYLVNDCNYYMHYAFMTAEGNAWTLCSKGEIEPNTTLFLEEVGREELNNLLKIGFQIMAYKIDKPFTLKPMVEAQFRLDPVKFYKVHTFQRTLFFDTPALLYTIVENDRVARPIAIDVKQLKEEMYHSAATPAAGSDAPRRDEGAQCHATAVANKGKDDVLVVDLHAEALLDTTAGMSHADILNYQVSKFKEVLDSYKNQKGKKIVFIHGKGEGVLRHAIINALNYQYKSYRYQDASFQEYGYGATQVTIK
ncbi:MAG: DUF2027 domain-containing protein [Prevotellaceae bacterium]|nr:DUF2027 domain-containing protein [Prevotella sp.]MDD7605173.1 DUF2027 domain-containing protein [Prevotellaceae bacterium]